MLVIGIGMAASGTYEVGFGFVSESGIFDPAAGLLGIFLLLAGVVFIGAAIDGIFTDGYYRPMDPVSLWFRSLRLIKKDTEEREEGPDKTADDESA